MSTNFVWSKNYKADLGKHIFPVIKYKLIRDKAINEKILTQNDFVEPKTATEEDILRVHTKEYLKRLKKLASNPLGMLNGENPVNESVLIASKLCCGGSYDACKIALKKGIAMNIGGGFHHAFPDHESGFCYYNDPAVAIRKLQFDKEIKKVMVVDCDVHQGDGTAFIFRNERGVFTFSIHQEDNFPIKQKSDYDISLYSYEGVDDKKYLKELEILKKLVNNFKPELIVYLAGADVFKEDQLGGFQLTKEGIKQRDEFVIDLAKENKIPIAILLAGGYAVDVNDTVEIHLNTVKIVKKQILNYFY